MTEDKEYSRRELLRNFAMLSSASLLLGLTGCGSGSDSGGTMYGPGPLYGPPAPVIPLVNGNYFVDPGLKKITLLNNQSVLVRTSFSITFSYELYTASAAVITFSDAAGNAIPYTQTWTDSRTLTITPSEDLAHDTTYTLLINEVTTPEGFKMSPNGGTITFKTVKDITISQGIWGTVRFWEGDFFPGPDNYSGTITNVIREIFIHKVTTTTESGSGPFFESIPTDLVATVSSDATGFYEVEVVPGTYSVFVKEDALFYANTFTGEQMQIQPVEVVANTVSELQIDITHKATF